MRLIKTVQIKQFVPLNVSSKFAICGVPIRVDSYKTCSFGCRYCFSNHRKIMEFSKDLQVGNINWLSKKLYKIFDKQNIDFENLLEVLVSNDYTWHWGGMSDPFQPVESKYNITKQLLDISNKYNRHILFSTKSDTVYSCDIIPKLHSFQLSVTNVDDRKDFEPNVSSISSRYKFFQDLKHSGFKVGIRVQPFIPNVSSKEIVDMFCDADNFTIEGLKIVPQNKDHKDLIMKLTGLSACDFTQMGLLNLKPEIRLELYKPFISELEKRKIPYSIADNDLHYIGTNSCCCGDMLIHKSTTFNNTCMIHKYGVDYTKNDLLYELENAGVDKCVCAMLFTSNRQEGCKTVRDFYDKRFNRKTSPFSPYFLYRQDRKDVDMG